MGLLLVIASGLLVAQSSRPDWIPRDAVPHSLERRAVETKARLESGIPRIQRTALRQILADVELYGRAHVRIATVPLLADFVSFEYRVLQMPGSGGVPVELRTEAVGLLGFLGGAEADASLREAMRLDPEGTVRASAAQALASRPGADPEADYAGISRALLSAVRRGTDSAEVTRLLLAARTSSDRVWQAENPDLLLALILIHDGPYSSSLRGAAFSFLEELANR